LVREDIFMAVIAKVQPEYLSVQAAETVTGISRWTWRRWAYKGRVESAKVGARLLIPRAEINRLMTESTRARIEQQP
jgi:excisionase family DNA binding protein